MKKEARILIVDDEEDILFTLRLFLKQHFTMVRTEHNPHHIPRLMRQERFDLILLDMNFRKGDTSSSDGLQWLRKVIELDPQATVIMITAYGDVKTAVEAVKAGATDFVEKPWRNEKLLATILSAMKLRQSQQAVRQLESRQKVLSADIDQQYGEIIGNAPSMQQIFSTIEKVARTDANVLILGENGTGKELIARAIHRQSLRNKEVFINVDLGAIPESLFESELFGHKKGAFTDAYEDRVGRFEVASGGTLFLDEIGNLSLPLQAKLLTVLQGRQIRRVGTNQPINIDIRLVCATNMPLYDMVKEQGFRQDLLYRINTVEITLPPLRQRREDIPLLVDHFLKTYARKYQKPGLKISAAALNKLQDYQWPGNIRELRHAVERAVILGDGQALQPQDFLFHDSAGDAGGDTVKMETYNLEEMEKWAIRQVLDRYRGNITKAAKELGLTRAALYRRMEKYDL
ncbi:MAG: sigma-54 dependent transcriptional regulator [Bacteroidota bacterium]